MEIRAFQEHSKQNNHRLEFCSQFHEIHVKFQELRPEFLKFNTEFQDLDFQKLRPEFARILFRVLGTSPVVLETSKFKKLSSEISVNFL